ncbi:hypothetical protein PSEUBRA_006144 [Kalmanozyma brasiliensis GHG001]|uniref:uncharacterized protein n=1 Tax=Kalmanozyma brasiliensis (strain GHG001) TaxID=1365824 RepID=UPI001CEB3930|nr:uncharacterized protein PSEUBRA_006144 [Kalmanozyma brasiliensis GHG001]KAF6767625.1 hypothetical protein PSEUBRA_006144 [Kalmanozyma brasiliensis GHG001]
MSVNKDDSKPRVADESRCIKLGCTTKHASLPPDHQTLHTDDERPQAANESSWTNVDRPIDHPPAANAATSPAHRFLRHFWDIVYNPSKADVNIDYLLDKASPWNSSANTMGFGLPDMIGYERKETATDLQPIEKEYITNEIVRYMREKELEGCRSIAPCISFKGTIVEVCCKNYDVADKLWESAPHINGLRMWVDSKAFNSNDTAAYRFYGLPQHTMKAFEQEVEEYAKAVPDHFDKRNMIVIAQYYTLQDDSADERIFTGDACIFIGLLEKLKRGKNDMLPPFLSVKPEMIDYDS